MQNVLNLDTLKKSVKIEVNKAKTSFIEFHIIREMHNGNTKPLFNFVSKSRGQSNHIGCLENTLPKHIADTLAEFFPLCSVTAPTLYQILHSNTLLPGVFLG